jgi:cyclopropane fatty-acyl-phospholipid synthase-like methyltransferase
MSNNKIDHFKHKSKSWDMNSKRVKNAQSISDLIVKNINLKESMEVMDLGAGTGLLSYFIAPYVKKIIAVDNSESMLEEFKNKASEFDSETEIIEADISKDTIKRTFDGIVSSMTIHHIEDINALFLKLFNMLNKDGFIAIADLDSEDGSFHSDNTGVYHYGFNRKLLEDIAKEVGFKNIHFYLASTINKPHANFTVFLMTASK